MRPLREWQFKVIHGLSSVLTKDNEMYLIFPEAMTIPEAASRREDQHFEDWLTATLKENTNRVSRDANESGVTPLFVKNCTLRGKLEWKRLAPKWSQLAISKAAVASPMIISGQVDVFPL
jgi:hypothetical protein